MFILFIYNAMKRHNVKVKKSSDYIWGYKKFKRALGVP